MAIPDAITIKHMGRTHTLSAGVVADLKSELQAITAVPPECQKLIVNGKVLADDDVVAPKSKGMMMRCAAQPKLLRLSVREIVTGRMAPNVQVAPSTPHSDLVATISKALLLPPCDEQTEVRIFLPHLGVLMRPDLALDSYKLPGTRTVEIFAVPCPKAPDPEHAAQIAHELGAAAAPPALHELSPDEARIALHHLAAHAAAGLAPHDAQTLQSTLNQLMPPPAEDEDDKDDEAPAAAEPFMLPPSMVDDVTETSSIPAGLAASSSGCGSSSDDRGNGSGSSNSGCSSSSGTKRQAPALSASTPTTEPRNLVPSRIRTGLMPAHDDPPPCSVERPLHAMLAAELEAYERAVELPSEAEWQAYMEFEEDRLEERCAELIASLAPPQQRSPHPSTRRRETRTRGGRPRRSRSAPLHARGGSSGWGCEASADAPPGARRQQRQQQLLLGSSSSATSLVGGGSSAPHSSARHSGLHVEETEGEASATTGALLLSDECCNEVMHEVMHEALLTPGTPRTPRCGDSPALPKGGTGGKVKGIACFGCGCRLPLTACATACKCGENYCPRCAGTHVCRFDYKRRHAQRLRDENPKMEGGKLERL